MTDAADTTERTKELQLNRHPPQRRGTAGSRWRRRKPINTGLVWLHRWSALILGLFLVLECTSGAVLLYHGDIFRATNGDIYHSTVSANPISANQAIDAVNKADPDFAGYWVAKDHGVYAVGNANYEPLYFVDPGTGHVNGERYYEHGFMGWLSNLHDCAFTCPGQPWYSPWLADPAWSGGPSFLTGLTWANLILGALGLLLLLLVVSSLRIWWPGWKRLRSRAVVRTGKGRFARDYDLHNVVGAVALPFLLMWGLTGAAFEFPGVEKGWLAITGGTPASVDQPFSLTPRTAPTGTAAITFDQAVSLAESKVGGHATWIGRPTKDVPYWEVDVQTGYGSSRYRAFYNGDAYVLIDPHYPDNVSVIQGGRGDSAGDRLYDKYLEPSHFGWNVNGWWRIIWLVLGLAPLILMITGVSTWLFRRGVRKRRRAALRVRDSAITPVDDLDAELKAGHVAEVDPVLVGAPAGTAPAGSAVVEVQSVAPGQAGATAVEPTGDRPRD